MTSKVIGIRLNAKYINKLKRIAEQNNLSEGQIAKGAVIDWIEIFHSARNLNMITIPKELFKVIIEKMENEEIKRYGRILAEKTLSFYEFLAHSHSKYIDINNFLNIIIRFLGSNGLMWFTDIDYGGQSPYFYFKGIHNMGKSFSLLIKYATEYIFDENFQFLLDTKNSNVNSNSISLKFKEKEKHRE